MTKRCTLVKSTTFGEVKKFDRAQHFNHTLWKKHPHAGAPFDGLPELWSTDGKTIRRFASEGRKLTYHTLHQPHLAASILARLEDKASRGTTMRGYSSFRENSAVVILHTASALEPGWIAYADAALETQSLLELSAFDRGSKSRIVAGGRVAWERRGYVLKGALEQRGSVFFESQDAIHLFAHLKAWDVEAFMVDRGETQRLELLTDEQPESPLLHITPTRVEATFSLDPAVCKQLERTSFSLWFRLSFDRELFCLPQEWCTLWLEVKMSGLESLTF